MCGPTQTLYYRVRRCSRPLCSSQRTTRHPPHDPAKPIPPRRADSGTRNRRALSEKKRSPALSGPNSVPTTPCSVRSVFHTPPR